MGENPKFPKIITRPGGEAISIGGMDSKVEYTSDWEKVDGAVGVSCRTWKIKNVDTNVDGADIIIEAGGHTPIQFIQAAEVVVDAPEEGEAFCCVMDTDGQIYVNHFDGTEKSQMVWSRGMIVCWVAQSKVRLTEFESPSFNEKMFINIPDDTIRFRGRPMSEYLKIVKNLKNH